MLQLKKFPNTRLHSKGSTRVPPTSRGDPFLPPSSRGGILSLRGGEKIPRVPVASQEEAISKGKARRTTESYHHSQSPANVSVIPGKPVFRALLRLSIRGWTHTTVVRGTALWESLEAKPPGKASRESHRSLVPLEWKRYSAATAREESARACPHSRRGLTLLGRLQKYPRSMSALERNPQVPAPTPHKILGPGIDGRGIPRAFEQLAWRLAFPDDTRAGP